VRLERIEGGGNLFKVASGRLDVFDWFIVTVNDGSGQPPRPFFNPS
jgi:hypothetical protein